MHIKLSRELSVPFSEGYDTSLADISENDFKDTPQVKWRKKKRKKQDLCNCCDHKFTSLTRLKAHIEVVHEGVNHAIIVIINSIQRTDLGSTGNHFHECVRQSCN